LFIVELRPGQVAAGSSRAQRVSLLSTGPQRGMIHLTSRDDVFEGVITRAAKLYSLR
jgi:hypothetical protein